MPTDFEYDLDLPSRTGLLKCPDHWMPGSFRAVKTELLEKGWTIGETMWYIADIAYYPLEKIA